MEEQSLLRSGDRLPVSLRFPMLYAGAATTLM